MFSCPHFHSNAILPVAALKSHSHNLLMKHCNTVGLKLDIHTYIVVIKLDIRIYIYVVVIKLDIRIYLVVIK